MKIERKEFYSSNHAPFAFERLQEFVDKLKREDVITIYENTTQKGYSYTLIYCADKEEG